MLRFAIIADIGRETLHRYLPANYAIVGGTCEGIAIGGEDRQGWTLADYVLPRLASGLYFGREVSAEEASAATGRDATATVCASLASSPAIY